MASGRNQFEETASKCLGVIEWSLHPLAVLAHCEYYLAFFLCLFALIGFSTDRQTALALLQMAGLQTVIAMHGYRYMSWNETRCLLIFGHTLLAAFSTELVWSSVILSSFSNVSALLLFLSILQLSNVIAAFLFRNQRVDFCCCGKNRRASGKNSVKSEDVEQMIFPLLLLPNELIRKIYRSLPLKVRRALRCNSRLAEIERSMRYAHERMDILLKSDGVHVRLGKEERSRDIQYTDIIPYDDFSNEMEILAGNSSIGLISYDVDDGEEGPVLAALRNIHADFVDMNSAMDDDHLKLFALNKKRLNIDAPNVTSAGLRWIFEKMLAEVDLIGAIIGPPFEEIIVFLETLGQFDRDSRIFSTTDPRIQILVNNASGLEIVVDNILMTFQDGILYFDL